MISAWIFEFACDPPLMHLAEELTVAAGVEVLYLPAQSNCCLRPSLLQASPRHWQQIRRRALSGPGFKNGKAVGRQRNRVVCIYHRDNFYKILFRDILSLFHHHQFTRFFESVL